ncbi:HAD-superfamily phosphatase, subfamily IIIC/FkbH-like domain-containing protein [Paenibacillus sp. CF095]|uniref:HAD-IIIC family phosphatase n=1 Tax=Paenibacillus sp. CF095 TaxID=1881033 RepID=UPI000885E28D|nr:HAD-IIIC family phosphatase [Paenibacillus sp. CF095]SDD50665.1 HAD-superfamily phosphatase, subfamily IIIC/FkbH-like domain-containing protein [Paenibacillus sp. CF095]
MRARSTTPIIRQEKQKIKCLVWDLDNTLWEGVLLEDPYVKLKENASDIVKELDRRGILQSISSKNDHNTALEKLQEFGLSEYFLCPQINWNSKSSSISIIQEKLNFGMETFAFIDDQPFEREEVAYAHPEVLCFNNEELDELLNMPEMMPRFVTDESKDRRGMYINDFKRKEEEEKFTGPQEEFLSSLKMEMRVEPAQLEDLKRAEELTVRTNQLNTTGYTYSFEELESFVNSERHQLLVTSLEDKYGTYGTIGLTLIEMDKGCWTLKLLLMSCRVMSRGVGSIMLNLLMKKAQQAGVRLQSEFVSNNKNRLMFITLKFAGFVEIGTLDNSIILENDLTNIGEIPEYVTLEVID